MAESTQRLEIVTPRRVVFQEDIKFLIAPGSDGELGILPEHSPLVTGLDIGVIRIEREGTDDNLKIAVSGGFMEVRDSRIIVLAEAAEESGEIDVERAEAAKRRAEERLVKPDPDVDVARAEAALQRALNRLATAG